MEEMINSCKSFVENLKGSDHSEDIGVTRNMILE
jgi:hypothetical protein